MKTEISRAAAIKQKQEYPCVLEYLFEDKNQELVLLFTERNSGVIIHQRGTAWSVGSEAKPFNADDEKWRPFEGSIKFS